MIDTRGRKLAALSSVPRLGFIQNMQSVLHIAYLGIPVGYVSGALWEKSLTQGLEALIAQGIDDVLIFDYDSIFTDKEVKELLDLYYRGDADAICCTQAHQHEDRLLPMNFGLTILNLHKLASIPKPWFNNSRGDSDMYFWKNWVSEGHLAYKSDIVIGHLAECVRWPSEDKVLIQPMHDFIKRGKPV